MSAGIDTTNDPFNPTPPSETEELSALATSLRLAQQFTLIFARCNQPGERQRLIEELYKRLPDKHIQQITFEGPIVHLLDRLRERIEDPTPDAIFVVGLENSLSSLALHGNTRFVANLNAARNSFGNYVPCPMVLWVPEYVLTAISRGAPDFFSVRSSIYRFDAPLLQRDGDIGGLDELNDLALPQNQSLSLAEASLSDLSLSTEERERLDHLYVLLTQVRRLPVDRRDPDMEIRLLNRIGEFGLRNALLPEAQSALEQSLSLITSRGDRKREAFVLNLLGRVDRHLAQAHRDHTLLVRSEEMHRKSCNLFHELNVMDGEANSLLELGRTLSLLDRLDEAEDAYRKSITLYGNANELYGYARGLNQLGVLLRQKKRLEEARTCHEEALTIYRRIQDREGEATALNYIGLIAREEGHYQEAEVNYKKSLQIRQETNDAQGQRIVLDNLSVLRNVQGDTAGGRTFKQQFEVIQKNPDRPNANEYGIEWIPIPAGEFLMGDEDMQDNPRHTVYLDEFSISKNPITVKQYLAFCDITGYEKPEPPDFNPAWSKEDHPIVNVNWHDAMAYCDWLTQQIGMKISLPTEAQWEKAARGTEGRRYPWGDNWDNSRLRCSKEKHGDAGGTAAVGSYPVGASPYGVHDMAGNVLEWCFDSYDATSTYRVARGGSWDAVAGWFRCSLRVSILPGSWSATLGFRCVAREVR